MLPNLEVRHLHAVIVLAEERNFTRAADRLHITQSTLSKQITEIEQQHRFHLFTRNNKKNVQLTEVGRIFAKEARSALVHIDRAVQLGRAALDVSADLERSQFSRFGCEPESLALAAGHTNTSAAV
jgi:LysR family cyn operon transcriptional activator